MITRVEGGLTYTQTFDAENRLISVTVSGQTTQFIYDGDGNLVKKVNPDNSKTIYVGGIYEVDKTSGGSVTRTVTYYPAAGAMRINSTLYYILKDHLGSASVTTDASGTILGEQRYYPFGETRLTTGTIYTDKLYTGQREITGLGIYHYGARFYSPKLGKFLSSDTITPNPADPQNFNRYSYTLNNPLRYTDPTGHMVADDLAGGCGLPSCLPSPVNPPDDDKPDPSDDEISLDFSTTDICNYGNCLAAATAAGLFATALDTFAFGMNLTLMMMVDVAAAIGFPMSLTPALAAYKMVAPIPNIIGSAGGAMWMVQGLLLGENRIGAGFTLDTSNGIALSEVRISAAVSQDTLVAGILDGTSWFLPEPNSAAAVSGAGVAYDVLRNPLAPSLSSAPPIIPTIINPSLSMSYNFANNSGSVNVSPFSP